MTKFNLQSNGQLDSLSMITIDILRALAILFMWDLYGIYVNVTNPQKLLKRDADFDVIP